MTTLPETAWLDLAEADRQLLRYKHRQITLPQVRTILICDCGLPEHLADRAIEETENTPLATLQERVR